MKITIGIDVGQKIDPTALAVGELQWRKVAQADRLGVQSPELWDHHVIRHLERLPLGTPYPMIVRRLDEVVRAVLSRIAELNRISGAEPGSEEWATLAVYVDATGVGTPVSDMLKAAGVPVIPVYFTHGDRRNELVNENTKQPYVHLGKAFIVAKLQALLQTHRIHLPRTEEARVLAKELLDFEIKVDKDANDKYGAFKVGTHDDLVTALGLVVQKATLTVPMPAVPAAFAPAALPTWATPPEKLAQPEHAGLLPGRSSLRGVLGVLTNWGPDAEPPERRREGWTP